MSASDKKHRKDADRHQKTQPMALHIRLLRFLLSQGGMFLLVAFVAAFGAWIFMLLERPYEDRAFLIKSLKVTDLEDSDTALIAYSWYLAGQNISGEVFSKRMSKRLEILQEFTLDMAHNYGYDGTKCNWTYSWDFTNALLFTVTIMTTIGYGHIAPKTTGGQLFTIMYAMIGTPLLLVFLANIGDGMARVFTFTYSRFCCRWCRSTRYKQQQKPGKRVKRLAEDVVGTEQYMPTDEVHVPITINLVIMALYLGLGAAIFSKWEEWDVSSAYYFSFVTLSTIGFGDMVPGNSFLDRADKNGFTKAFKMGITIGYCFVGMALISMCIQMMQMQIISKVRWSGQELGLIEDENRPQRRMRRTRRGAAPETKYPDRGSDTTSAARQQRQQQRLEETDKRKQQRQEQQQPMRENEQHEERKQPMREDEQLEEHQERQTPQLSDNFDDLFNLA